MLFPFGKKYHFMQKVLVFGQRSEFLSTVIKSCRANFGVKWRVFFSTSIFVQKCQFWAKIIEVLWEMLTFWNYCALLLKVVVHNSSSFLIGKHAYFQKIFDFLCECLYTLRNCQNMIKTSIFLRKCLFVHVLIFIRVFLLLENCYFDSKYDFIRWYFGQKCHFSNKIYLSCGINSLEKSSNFLRKGVNIVVSFGKNDVWFLK